MLPLREAQEAGEKNKMLPLRLPLLRFAQREQFLFFNLKKQKCFLCA
jgi:hypothetical protein